ncbi:MAG: hypothetical protein GF346_04300 [Candidatus Eisenbacteria bacterium]|nr:hypothetical protein [Candidatus Latescibacterota bacterium]MBD3301648.1 hypothetical protein [Candidatus Eisenbacteria bacterium]
MSIPPSPAGDKTEACDLLVVAPLTYEISKRFASLPARPGDPLESIDPIERIEDGGGSALNSACALAAAGRRVVAVCCGGADEDGTRALRALEKRGVDCRATILPGRRTKRNLLAVVEGTKRSFFRVEAPGDLPAPMPLPADLPDARVLLVDRDHPGLAGRLRARKDRPDRRNVMTRYTRAGLPDLGPFDLLQLPERAEGPEVPLPPPPAGFHSPASPPPMRSEEIDRLLSGGIQVLVRTFGSGGAIVHERNGRFTSIPARRTEVVDATGAGDAFLAGFLDALLDHAPVSAAGHRGADWAARAVRHLGARGWLDREPPGRIAEP